MRGKRKRVKTTTEKARSNRKRRAAGMPDELDEIDEADVIDEGEQSEERDFADGPDDFEDPEVPEEEHGKTEHFTVKCSLRSICNDISKALPWDTLMKDLNKTTKEAHVLANMHIIRLLETHRPIPILEKSFFMRCLSAVCTSLKTRRMIDDEDLRQSIELYRSWRGHDVSYANGGYAIGWHQNESAVMATNACNHIIDNFYHRFENYVKQRFGLTGAPRYELLRDILAPAYEGSDARVLQIRQWIPRARDGQIDRAHPHLLLPVLFRFLRFIEVQNFLHRHQPVYKKLRSFSLLPLKKGFECSHFSMCKLGLYFLMKRAGTPLPPIKRPVCGGLCWNDIADDMWYNLFDLRRFETATYKFAGRITTDGKAASILMLKTARADRMVSFASGESHPIIPDRNDFDQVWGLDPGRREVFVATNSLGETVSCSTPEFYHDAKYSSSNKTSDYWMARNRQYSEAAHSMPSAKTCSLVKLHRFVRFLIPRLDMMLDFRIVKPFRKLRLRRYIFMKRKLHELCRTLTSWAGTRTFVGFGDWSATDYRGFIKRCRPGGSVKKLKSALMQHCTVGTIPEFRTSRLHAECLRELSYQHALRRCKDGVERYLPVYRVLHCRHSGCFGTTVNRDKNASKNILLLTEFYLRDRVRHPAFT